jgi:hypothetical protein
MYTTPKYLLKAAADLHYAFSARQISAIPNDATNFPPMVIGDSRIFPDMFLTVKEKEMDAVVRPRKFFGN